MTVSEKTANFLTTPRIPPYLILAHEVRAKEGDELVDFYSKDPQVLLWNQQTSYFPFAKVGKASQCG